MAPFSTHLRTVARSWLLTLVLATLYLLSGWPGGRAGLVRTVVVKSSAQPPSDVRRVSAIDVPDWSRGPTLDQA